MIYLGADHRGFEMKGRIAQWCQNRGYEFEDMGAYQYEREDDYVDFGLAVAQRVGKAPQKHRGILLCGSGVGMDVTANKELGVRCGLGFEVDQVHCARKDDNINVLALAADNLTEEEMFLLVEAFLETEFVESEKYTRRIGKISRYEKEVMEKHG